MTNNKKAIIIGSGVAGIAVAIRLQRMGFDVEVFESASTFGGKIKEIRKEGFRFDTGPSLLTLPGLIRELFDICDKPQESYLKFHALESVTRYFFPEGKVLDSFSNPDKFANQAQQVFGVDTNRVTSYLRLQKKNYELLAPVFLENPIHKPSKLLKLKYLPSLFHIMQPSFLKSMDAFNSHWFRNSPLVKIFNRYGTYNGSNPYQMSSLFNIIAHLEHNTGAYLPENGMRGVAEALYRLACDIGVKFRFNQYVDRIRLKGNKCEGIQYGNEFHGADCIVCNMDVALTYSKLLPETKPPRKTTQQPLSTSALIFQWAVKGIHNQLDVHNILFSENYKEEFRHLFQAQTLVHDPTIYLYISSKLIKNDAPEGCENWFVMINTPPVGNWELDLEKIRKRLMEKIAKITGIKLEGIILSENLITPHDIEVTTHSFKGSLYGANSNDMLSALYRHPNFSKYENLYFCGGTVHPGGGIPLALYSARIVAQLVNDQLK